MGSLSNQWYIGMKAHIGVDAKSRLILTQPPASCHGLVESVHGLNLPPVLGHRV